MSSDVDPFDWDQVVQLQFGLSFILSWSGFTYVTLSLQNNWLPFPAFFTGFFSAVLAWVIIQSTLTHSLPINDNWDWITMGVVGFFGGLGFAVGERIQPMWAVVAALLCGTGSALSVLYRETR